MFVLLSLMLARLERLLALPAGRQRPTTTPLCGTPAIARASTGAAQPIPLALIHAPLPRLGS